MNYTVRTALLFIATIVAGLLAGFFYTWSFTIMQSLNLISESNAISAMISINANIRSGWFAVIFFGTPVLILFSLMATLGVKKKGMPLCLLIALVLAIATFVITFARHLPLNEQLENGLNWPDYVVPWVQWNHARMVTSVLAFISMLFALIFNIKNSKPGNAI